MGEEQGFNKKKNIAYTYTNVVILIFHPLILFFFKFANMQSEKEQKK